MKGYFLLEMVVALTLCLSILYTLEFSTYSAIRTLKDIQLYDRPKAHQQTTCTERPLHDETLIHCKDDDSNSLETFFIVGR